MYPDFARTLGHRQRGAGLPIALFVITVLALLVTTMSQLQQTSGELTGLQVQQTRAFYAAETGAQASLNLLLPPDGSAGQLCATSPFYQRTFSQPGLQGCSATVSCTSAMVDGAGYYTLRSEGVCGAGPDEAKRLIEVRAQ
jgi:MSHA biogenesis protein MshP